VARQPMGRLGTPEVAAVAVLLASDESAFTSGIAYFVDGECDSGTPYATPLANQTRRRPKASWHAELRMVSPNRAEMQQSLR